MGKTTWSDVVWEFERKLKKVKKRYDGNEEQDERIRDSIDAAIENIKDGEYMNADRSLDIFKQVDDPEADRIRQCVVVGLEIDEKHPATVLRCLKKKL